MIFKIPKHKYYFLLMDIFIVLISLILSRGLSIKLGHYKYIAMKNPIVFDYSIPFIILLVIFPIVYTFTLQYNNLYKLNVCQTRALHFTQIIKVQSYLLVLIVFVSFLFSFSLISESRLFLLSFFIISTLLFFLLRVLILRELLVYLSRLKIIQQNILIIGAGKSASLLAVKILFENDIENDIVGFIDDKVPIGTTILNQKKVLGKVSNLLEILSEYKIDEIIISIDNISYERLWEIIDACRSNNLPVRINSELFTIIPEKIKVDKYSEIPIVDATPKINAKYVLAFKKMFDFILAALGLMLLSPFFLIASILIKCSSTGPIMFKQERIGLHGKPFSFIKFRSMTISNNRDFDREKKMISFMKTKTAKTNSVNKVLDESRVTKIGSFLRKYSLDELPQLINVLTGDMSLVGPRPCLPYEYENYDEWYKRRLDVLPGCTGVWQVFGRSKVSFKDSIVLDLYYINNMSPWLDLQLILKTIPVVIFGRGGK